MQTITQLTQEAILLPEDQRLTLAHKLLTAGEPALSRDVQNAWDAEIRHRIDRYDRGESRALPASEVFDRVDSAVKE